MTYFVGIDVSMEESSICIIHKDGDEIDEGRVPTNPESIAEFLSDYADEDVRLAIETGPISSWLWHELTALGFQITVLDARSVHQVLKVQRNKTDRGDARGIAQVHRSGWCKEARVKSYDSHARRALLKARSQLVSVRQDLENSVRGLLKPFGLLVPRAGRATFASAVRARCKDREELCLAVDALLKARDEVRAQIKTTDKALLKAARSNDDCRRLMTIPGVGPMTSLAFLSSIEDAKNFPRARAVGAYFGLTPRRYQSGDVDYQGRICKRGDAMVRTLLYEAAGVLLTVVRKFNTIKAWGLQVAKRAGMRKAKVAVARKLAVIMATILKDGTEFDWSTGKA